MPATMNFENVIIHSVDSDILVILAHGHYLRADEKQTTVPHGTTLVWHSAHDNVSIIPQGKRFITGADNAIQYIRGTGERTAGGQPCTDYTLSCEPDDPMLVRGTAKVDYATIVPGKSAPLSDIWDFMANRRLRYSYVYYWACRVGR